MAVVLASMNTWWEAVCDYGVVAACMCDPPSPLTICNIVKRIRLFLMPRACPMHSAGSHRDNICIRPETSEVCVMYVRRYASRVDAAMYLISKATGPAPKPNYVPCLLACIVAFGIGSANTS